MARKLQIKRGNKVNLPTLAQGEFGLALDTAELFIGGSGGNKKIGGGTATETSISNELATELGITVPAKKNVEGGLSAVHTAISAFPLPTAETQILISDMSDASNPKYKTVEFASAKAKPVSNFMVEKVKTLGDLPVGSLVKDTGTTYYNTPIVWQIADKNHSGYPANSVTLITDNIITLKCFDGKEPANSDGSRKNYGNNRYIYANMRRWLNSPAGAGAWYAAQHSADAPPNSTNASANPYDTQAGFLNTFGSDFLNALLITTLTVARNTVTDGGSYETLTDKLFLASNTEVGLEPENNIVEGAKLALFTDNASRVATPTVECVSNGRNGTVGSGWYWWLRTPCAFYSCDARIVNSDGTLGNHGAYNGGYGVRPLCNLLSSILVSDNTDADGCYTIVDFTPTGNIGLKLTWQHSIDAAFAQRTIIRRSDDNYPATITDGVAVYQGTAEACIDNADMTIDQYYSAFGDNGIILSDAVNAKYNATTSYLMLYDQGDECIDVTGGWDDTKNTQFDKNPIQKTLNSIKCNIGPRRYSVAATTSIIDFTKYNQLGIRVKNSLANESGKRTTGMEIVSNDLNNIGSAIGKYEITSVNMNYKTYNFNLAGIQRGVLRAVAYVTIGYTADLEFSNVFLLESDDWQTWATTAGLNPVSYASLEALLKNASAMAILGNSTVAINYMISRCTGTVMGGVLGNDTAFNAMNTYAKQKMAMNEHWKKFAGIYSRTL